MSDLEEARHWLGEVTDRDLFIAGIALYAGEVSKGPGSVQLPNSDPRMISLLLTWLRRFFEVDESRLRLWLGCPPFLWSGTAAPSPTAGSWRSSTRCYPVLLQSGVAQLAERLTVNQ